MTGYTYIIANRKNGTLYTGVTADLPERVAAHREKRGAAFAVKYECTRLVWYTEFDDVADAIAHEKRVKGWRRNWKVKLIEEMNPDWDDLWFWLTGL